MKKKKLRVTKKKKEINLEEILKKKKISEKEFLDALDTICKNLIYKFKFGYHDVNDMKQQASIFAIEGLKRYDSSRPLANFLWTHVRNRLFNFKRNNFSRPDNVCHGCIFFDPKRKKSTNQCARFTNKEDCSIWSKWNKRNEAKKNLMHPSAMDNIEVNQEEHNFLEKISNKELINLIEDNLGVKYREMYLKLKGGIKISKNNLKQLQEHIQTILQDKDLYE